MRNSLGYIECLELFFRYKGKDELVGQFNEALNSFEAIKDPKADRQLETETPNLHDSMIYNDHTFSSLLPQNQSNGEEHLALSLLVGLRQQQSYYIG